MKVEIDFDEKEIEYLNPMACKSFFHEQSDRFEILSDRYADQGWFAIVAAEHAGRGCFKWFDSLLDAKIYQSYYQRSRGNDSVLLWDMTEPPQYCLWIDEREIFLFNRG